MLLVRAPQLLEVLGQGGLLLLQPGEVRSDSRDTRRLRSPCRCSLSARLSCSRSLARAAFCSSSLAKCALTPGTLEGCALPADAPCPRASAARGPWPGRPS